ncbi:MAG: DUF1015 family protein, partial [bacterium]
MVTIKAFEGITYNKDKVRDISQVIAPPYDVIDTTLQKKLYDRNAYNVIRLILGLDEKGDNEHKNKYSRAANDFKSWLDSGIINRNNTPAIFAISQEFEIEGIKHCRLGFIALLQVEEEYG